MFGFFAGLLLAFALTFVPHAIRRQLDPSPIRVDRVELNRCEIYGSKPFTQLLFYRWERRQAKYGHQLAQWVLCNTDPEVRTDQLSGMKRIVFWTGGKRHEVLAASYAETDTAFDPELRERERVPVEMRTPYF